MITILICISKPLCNLPYLPRHARHGSGLKTSQHGVSVKKSSRPVLSTANVWSFWRHPSFLYSLSTGQSSMPCPTNPSDRNPLQRCPFRECSHASSSCSSITRSGHDRVHHHRCANRGGGHCRLPVLRTDHTQPDVGDRQ